MQRSKIFCTTQQILSLSIGSLIKAFIPRYLAKQFATMTHSLKKRKKNLDRKLDIENSIIAQTQIANVIFIAQNTQYVDSERIFFIHFLKQNPLAKFLRL